MNTLAANEAALLFADVLRENKALKSFGLRLCKNSENSEIASGTNRGVSVIASALEGNTGLTDLQIGCRRVEAGAASSIKSMLLNNKAIRNLKLQHNEISQESDYMAKLTGAIRQNTTLLYLDLSDNPSWLGDNEAAALADANQKNKSLRGLNLRHCKIKSAGVIALAKALEKNSSLVELDMSY